MVDKDEPGSSGARHKGEMAKGMSDKNHKSLSPDGMWAE